MQKYQKFAEDDPVWVKCGKQWWPALTCTTPHGNLSSIPKNQAFRAKPEDIFKRSEKDRSNWPSPDMFPALPAGLKAAIKALGPLGEELLEARGKGEGGKRPPAPAKKKAEVEVEEEETEEEEEEEQEKIPPPKKSEASSTTTGKSSEGSPTKKRLESSPTKKRVGDSSPTKKRLLESSPTKKRLESSPSKKKPESSPKRVRLSSKRENREEAKLGKGGLDLTFRATLLIQKLFRGWAGRQEARRQRLWKAWNALDIKAENDLVQSQRTLVQIKELYNKNLQKTQKSETSETKSIENQMKKELESVPKSEAVAGSHASLPRLSGTAPLSLEFVTKMMDEFKRGKMLDRENVLCILERVTPVLKKLPNVVPISVHPGGKITIVGDVHGQLNDVLGIFELNGIPSPRNQYLFNGDIVDRGPCGAECALILLAFKILFPEAMHINRGNHESDDVNEKDGFFDEISEKYHRPIYDAFSEAFAALPIASIIQEKVWVVHGGLTAPSVTLSDIMKINRFVRTVPSDTVMEEMLWSDPQTKNGRTPSDRGAGFKFGPDVTKAWLNKNKLELVVRSHEVASNGYVKLHGGALYTVFSASNYCGEVGNKGAIMLLEYSDMSPNCVTFTSKANAEIGTSHLMSLEQHVIPQICTAIAVNRIGLIDFWSKLKGSGELISRTEWNNGLSKVLGLAINFLPFQRQLGLPLLGHDGKKGGAINYMVFLNRFRPIFASSAPSPVAKKSKKRAASPAPPKSPSKEPRNSAEAKLTEEGQLLEEMAQFLFKERYQLRSLFRFFDLDGNGTINKPELKAGLNAMGTVFKRPITSQEVDKLFALLDTNGDGEIDYEELVGAVNVPFAGDVS